MSHVKARGTTDNLLRADVVGVQPAPPISTDTSSAAPFPQNVVLRFTHGVSREVVLGFAAFTCDDEGTLMSDYDLNPEQQALIWRIMEEFCLEHRGDLGLIGPFWRTDMTVRIANSDTINMSRTTELLTAAFKDHGITLINQTSHPRVPVGR